MAEPIAKIASLSVAKPRNAQGDELPGAVLLIPFTVEVGGTEYQHTIKVVSEPLTILHGTNVTSDLVKRVITEQATIIQKMNALAEELTPTVAEDLVAAAKAAAAETAAAISESASKT